MATLAPEKIAAPEKITLPPDLEISEDAKKILRAARDLISLGWTQGQIFKDIKMPDGEVGFSYCMIGGIYAGAQAIMRGIDPAGYDPRGMSSMTEVIKVTALPEAERAVKRVVGGIIAFNDPPWRKKEHVLAVLDELIAS